MNEEFYPCDGTVVDERQAYREHAIQQRAMEKLGELGRRPDETNAHGKQEKEQNGKSDYKKKIGQRGNDEPATDDP